MAAAEHRFTYTVGAEDNQKKVSQVLTTRLGMSGQTLIRLKRSGTVENNGLPVYLKDLVRSGDRLTVVLREERQQDLLPEEVHLDITFEDEHLIVINKPPGMVVHPTKGYLAGTLANALVAHYAKTGQSLIVRPVHRLDRDTSGLVLWAKNPHVQAVLTAEHSSGEWQKSYLAMVTGVVQADSGRIDAPIMRVGGGSRARVVSPEGQQAITLWEKIAVHGDNTLQKVTLITGRTHQVRVHMAHIGHPLVGDEVYGSFSPLISRQALHAAWQSFRHPVSGERISLFVPPPADFQALLFPTS
ncbi:MAG: RluA family pseudouridine synthase [Peptococcaceae bacterium]|nr:RluA family pseudouridine synthase [Peptococcaceae bacterium]